MNWRRPLLRRPPPSFRTQIGPDGFYEDCVGPSSYYKAQGIPVRIWGLLANGQVFVTVLPKVGGVGIAKHVPSNPIMIRPKPVAPAARIGPSRGQSFFDPTLKSRFRNNRDSYPDHAIGKLVLSGVVV